MTGHQHALALESDAPAITPREWQAEAITTVADAYRNDGHRRQLLVAATGLGKTVIFASMASRLDALELPGLDPDGGVLVLAHRDELIKQAAKKFRAVWPGIAVGTVKAEQNELAAPVVVASVQTAAQPRRLQQLASRRWRFVVVDEAHHATADTYRRVLDAVGAGPDVADGEPTLWPGGSRPLLLGVTATPDRLDQAALGAVFDHVAAEFDMLWGIRSGFLSDLRGVAVDLDLDLDQVKTSRGDWSEGQLGRAMEDAHAPQVAVQAWRQHADGRPTVAFTPTIATARAMAEEFTRHGIKAAHVSGETPGDQREAMVADLAAGRLRVLANCNVLTEGFDEPSIGCVLMARPTKSRGLYTQMVGRGTRRHPGKDDCLVLDLVGNSDRHELVTITSLFGLHPDDVKKGGGSIAAATDARDVRLEDEARASQTAMRITSREVDLWASRLRAAKLAWIETGDGGWTLGVGSAGRFVLVPEPDDPESWRALKVAARRQPETVLEGVDLATAMAVAEDHVRDYLARVARREADGGRGADAAIAKATALTNPDAPWRSRQPSAKQVAYARRLHIDAAGMTAGQVADAIDAAKARTAARKA